MSSPWMDWSTPQNTELVFSVFLEPRLESGFEHRLEKNQVFSPAAEMFLQKIQEAFGEID